MGEEFFVIMCILQKAKVLSAIHLKGVKKVHSAIKLCSDYFSYIVPL